jgi:hypothetical protein
MQTAFGVNPSGLTKKNCAYPKQFVSMDSQKWQTKISKRVLVVLQ